MQILFKVLLFSYILHFILFDKNIRTCLEICYLSHTKFVIKSSPAVGVVVLWFFVKYKFDKK